MNPAEAIAKLAALNWSGVPAEHQIAVSAALETLKAIALPDARKLAMSSAYGTMRGPKPVALHADMRSTNIEAKNILPESNVIILPITRWTRLYHLDGRPWASASHFGPEGAWGWVLETVAAEHGVSEDQINSAESDETQPYDCDDLVLIDGLPAYRLRHTSK